MTTEQIIDKILEDEGGFVNNPADRGGPTNFGITLETLEDWRHMSLNLNDIKNLTKEEAYAIYYQRYVRGPGFEALNVRSLLKYLLVDMWVNHGPKRATLIIQKALGIPGDGILGPRTLNALSVNDSTDTLLRILAERIRFYGRLITKNPDQAGFAAGWMDRCADFLKEN